MLTDHDIYLFREGTHSQLHSRLGCQVSAQGTGAHFAVWAPNARAVSVVGDWNGWKAEADPLKPREDVPHPRRRPLDLDEDAGRVVADMAGQAEPGGERVDERAEAHPLDHALHLDRRPDVRCHQTIVRY